MDGFNEQVVKRATKAKNIVIKILSVVILLFIPVLFTFLAFTITTYMFYVGLFLFIGGIYMVWYIFSCQKVEFEYSVAGNELKISKIIALRSRKNICKININEIEELEKGDKITKGKRFTKTFIAARDFDKDDENYYAIFNSPAYGRSLLVFTPNDDILQGMKPHLNKNIVLKLFYHRNTGR